MKRNACLLSGSEAVLEHRSCNKDLPEIGTKLYEPSSSWLEANRLKNALQERHSLISQPRIERDCSLCVGEWDSDAKRVIVLKKRGKELETFGHHDPEPNLYILNPEEALFLVESNSMILLNNGIEVSVEMCYALLIGAEESKCSLNQYRVFSHLSRLGYKVIRHKKPLSRESTIKTPPALSSNKGNRTVDGRSKGPLSANDTSQESIVVIEDSSSEDDDDIVILDVIEGSRDKDVIQIEDEDSRDSDIVFLGDNPNLVELPLENWSYVHRCKFLSKAQIEENPVVRLDPLIISQSEQDILDEIPNIKGHKSWLFRQDENLLPHGVWPFHYKYLIALDEQKNWNNRGRGGFRGYRGFRGRGYYLQRQVSQMKNYTISLMNMVSQLMGGQGLQVIPPPPALLHGPNYRRPRGGHLFGRVSWGRIPSNSRGSGYRVNGNGVPVTEMIELSDDEEKTEDNKRLIKKESFEEEEDVKPKKLKLEQDAEFSTNVNLKVEPIDLKKEPNDVKPDLTTISIKTENQIKMETDSDAAKPSSSNKESSENTPTSGKEFSESSAPDDVSHQAEETVPKPLNGTTAVNNEITSSFEEKSSVNDSPPKSNANETLDESISTKNNSDDKLEHEIQTSDENSLEERKQPDSIELEKSNLEIMEVETNDPCDNQLTSSSNLDTNNPSRTDVSLLINSGNEDQSVNIKSSVSIGNNENEHMNKNSSKQCEKQSNSGGKSTEQVTEENNLSISAQNSSEDNEGMQAEIQRSESIPSDSNSTDSSSLVDAGAINSKCQLEKSEKKTCWKELKESETSGPSLEEGCLAKESIDSDHQDGSHHEDFTSLIEPRHCSSLDNVLKRLSIFKEFKSKLTEKDLVVDVKYDVYLPTSVYYRNLPPSPDLRVIILRPEDPLPDANQMTLLKQIYNDNKNFLFAVVLPESIAYYLYDTVYLPVDSETL